MAGARQGLLDCSIINFTSDDEGDVRDAWLTRRNFDAVMRPIRCSNHSNDWAWSLVHSSKYTASSADIAITPLANISTHKVDIASLDSCSYSRLCRLVRGGGSLRIVPFWAAAEVEESCWLDWWSDNSLDKKITACGWIFFSLERNCSCASRVGEAMTFWDLTGWADAVPTGLTLGRWKEMSTRSAGSIYR